MEVYEPYANRIHDGKLENAPQKAIEAFEKVKSGHGNKASKSTVDTTSRETGGIFTLIFKKERIKRWILEKRSMR